MAPSTSLRGRPALVLAIAATLAAGLPQAASATASASDPAAVSAVNVLLGQPTGDAAVLSATYSPDHTHIAYRQAFHQPAGPQYDENNGSDVWVIRADGTSKTRLSNDVLWQNSASAPIRVSDAQWAPDSSGLAYESSGPGHLDDVVTRTFTSTASGDDWTGSQDYSGAGYVTDFAYTADSRWLVYRLASTSIGATDYAVDRTTAKQYSARWVGPSADGTGSATKWSPDCATAAVPGYVPSVHTGNDVVDALTGPNVGCSFAGQPTNTPSTDQSSGGSTATVTVNGGDTSSATSAGATQSPVPSKLNDSPGVTAGGAKLVPINDRIPTIPGPALRITDVGQGLATARRNGLHVKISLDRIAKVKVWAILTGTGARYSTDEAFAGVPATTLARASTNQAKAGVTSLFAKFDAKGRDKLDAVDRITLQVKVTATDVAGRVSTVVQDVKLRR